jgi:plasmid stability protein
MAAISVRDLDDDVAARLKVRAARHGRSMEAEVRAILTGAVAEAEDERVNLAQALRQRFAAIGGVEVPVPSRSDLPRAADLPDLP